MMTMFRTVRTGGLKEIGFTAAPAGLAMHGRRGRMPYRSS
jgi:hypothetical protein